MENYINDRSAVLQPVGQAEVIQLFPLAGSNQEQHLGLRPRQSEWGMATAEYAVATLAAVGFAGLLVVILRSEEVRGFLLGLIRNALSIG